MYSMYNRWVTAPLLFILILTVYYKSYTPVYILQDNALNLATRNNNNKNTVISQTNSESNDRTVRFLQQFKNPCFVTNFDDSISDKEYYKNQPFIRRLEAKYATTLRGNLHRAAITVQRDDGSLEMKRLSCLPYYYVLGVAKSGSTDLYERLQWHKHVAEAVRKENAFFNTHRFENYTITDYVDVFDTAAVSMRDLLPESTAHGHPVPLIVGDHSTNTFSARRSYTPDQKIDGQLLPNSTAELIKQLTPDARFIVLFRNPVERAYSHYKMHFAKSATHFHNGVVTAIHWLTTCFEQEGYSERCLYTRLPKPPQTRDEDDVSRDGATSHDGRESRGDHYDGMTSVRQGVYYAFVQEWLRYFPKQQFLFIQSESYYADPYKAVTQTVFPFLDLEPLQWYDQWVKFYINNRPPVHVTSRLIKTAEKDINTAYKEPMFNGTRQLLADFYREHNVKLAKLLNNDMWLW